MKSGAFAAILNSRGEVLLVRSNTNQKYVDYWSLPGGIVEDDETPKAGAAREVLEETGIVCSIDKLLSRTITLESNLVIHVFKASYMSGEIKLQIEEIMEATWIKVDDALKLPLAYNTFEILKLL